MDSNTFMVWMLRSPLGRWMGKSMLLVMYTGRQSGKKYQVPVNYVRSGEEWLVTSQRDRTWWRNFRGGGQAQVLAAGKVFQAQGEVLDDPTVVAEKLGAYLAGAPGVARYFAVSMDEAGHANPQNLAEAAKERVMVVFRVISSVQA